MNKKHDFSKLDQRMRELWSDEDNKLLEPVRKLWNQTFGDIDDKEIKRKERERKLNRILK